MPAPSASCYTADILSQTDTVSNEFLEVPISIEYHKKILYKAKTTSKEKN